MLWSITLQYNSDWPFIFFCEITKWYCNHYRNFHEKVIKCTYFGTSVLCKDQHNTMRQFEWKLNTVKVVFFTYYGFCGFWFTDIIADVFCVFFFYLLCNKIVWYYFSRKPMTKKKKKKKKKQKTIFIWMGFKNR